MIPKIKNRLIMFVKEPKLGFVKTRLAKQTSDEFALALYENFIKDLMQTVEGFDCALYVHPNKNAFSFDATFLQKGDDLGAKMSNAFKEEFAKGYEKIVLIGSDTPHLSTDLLNKSFESLSTHEMVLGPSLDGGYYLIGFTKKGFNETVFENITWSSEVVLEQTLQTVNKKALYLLMYMNDIDTKEDLDQFYVSYKNQWKNSHTIQFLKAKDYGKV